MLAFLAGRFERLLWGAAAIADYGFVERTLGEDGDLLDALVLVGDPTFPGCRIRVRTVAVFRMVDERPRRQARVRPAARPDVV